MNKSLIITSAFLLVTIACAPQMKEEAALPTIAALPSVTPNATITTTPSSELTAMILSEPTFTLVPPITTLQAVMTAYWSDKAALSTQSAHFVGSMMTVLAPSTLTSKEMAMYMTSAWQGLQTAPYMKVEFETVERVMPISDGQTKNRSIGGSGGEDYLKFFYEYKSDSLSPATYMQRVPYLLCELREAGLNDLNVTISLDLKSSRGKERRSDYLCISSDSISKLNCEDPSRTNIEAIRHGGNCD